MLQPLVKLSLSVHKSSPSVPQKQQVSALATAIITDLKYDAQIPKPLQKHININDPWWLFGLTSSAVI